MLFAFYFSYISRNRMRCMQRSWLKLIGKQLDRIDLLLIGGNLHQNTQLYELNVDLTVRWSKLIQFNFLNHILMVFLELKIQIIVRLGIYDMLYIRGYIFVEGCRTQHIICQSIDEIVFTNSWIMYLKVTCGRDATMGIQRNKGRAGCYFCAIFPPSHPHFLSDHALNKQSMPWQMDPNICN